MQFTLNIYNKIDGIIIYYVCVIQEELIPSKVVSINSVSS